MRTSSYLSAHQISNTFLLKSPLKLLNCSSVQMGTAAPGWTSACTLRVEKWSPWCLLMQKKPSPAWAKRGTLQECIAVIWIIFSRLQAYLNQTLSISPTTLQKADVTYEQRKLGIKDTSRTWVYFMGSFKRLTFPKAHINNLLESSHLACLLSGSRLYQGDSDLSSTGRLEISANPLSKGIVAILGIMNRKFPCSFNGYN